MTGKRRLKIIAGSVLGLLLLLATGLYYRTATGLPVELIVDSVAKDGGLVRFKLVNHTRREFVINQLGLTFRSGRGWTNNFEEGNPKLFFIQSNQPSPLSTGERQLLSAEFPSTYQKTWRASVTYTLLPSRRTGLRKYLEQAEEFIRGSPSTNSVRIHSPEIFR